MAKKKSKSLLPDLSSQPILQPLDITLIGSNGDPCFGKGYDLSTKECKVCGDAELCAIKLAASLGKTRKELELENNYKDLDSQIDKPGIKKYYRSLSRAGKTKKEIIVAIQNKYKITLSDTRLLYREFTSK